MGTAWSKGQHKDSTGGETARGTRATYLGSADHFHGTAYVPCQAALVGLCKKHAELISPLFCHSCVSMPALYLPHASPVLASGPLPHTGIGSLAFTLAHFSFLKEQAHHMLSPCLAWHPIPMPLPVFMPFPIP